MLKVILFISVLLSSQPATAGNELTTCYTNVEILGLLDETDSAIAKIGHVFDVHGLMHRPANDKLVAVQLLVSVTALEPGRAREQTEADFVKRIILMASRQSLAVTARFLGCKSETLN